MKTLLVFLTVLLLAIPWAVLAEKQRVVVLTDISNEPDDEESLVRFLVYANEYDVEGLIATTSTWLRERTREDLIRRQLSAYAQVRTNLVRHAPGFPTAERLISVTFTGQTGYGMAAVGMGRSSPGSRHLLALAQKADARPLWVSIWGGANTLAQTLQDARRELPAGELQKVIRRLRAYSISDQDDAGHWLRREFPELVYIVSPSTTDWKEYWRATWTGISGDRHYRNGPMHRFEMVDNPWLEKNVIQGHGPLGELYPRLAYIMEGDTPSFLGLIQNGLGWAVSPAYGGWGGRYSLYQAYGESRPIWTNNQDSRDTVTADNGQAQCTDQATIWRWREDFQNDFAARMDWCVRESYEQANHNPIAVINEDATREVLEIAGQPGGTVELSAKGSKDSDGQRLTFSWFIYHEAGTNSAKATLSTASGEQTRLSIPESDPRNPSSSIHVILAVRDAGDPPLTAYRRVIVTAGAK